MDDFEQVTALYPHDVEIAPLLQSLRNSGVSDAQIAVMTPLPLSERASARLGITPLYLITIVAGLVGIGVGIFFAGGTAAMYPLMTGGKPIVAAPVVGIISYETMMLLAIIVTFVATIAGIRYAQRAVGERDARIDDGYIMVVVSVPSDTAQVMLVRALLQRANPLELHCPGRPSGEEMGGERSGQAVAVILVAICAIGGCSRDMQEQPSYHPQEAPRLHSPAASIPRDSRRVLGLRTINDAAGDGRVLFRVNCSHCHGREGAGDGPVSSYLKEKPPNLRKPEVQRLSESALFEIITNGKDVMPPFKGELSVQERRSIVTHVKSLPDTPNVDAGE